MELTLKYFVPECKQYLNKNNLELKVLLILDADPTDRSVIVMTYV